MSEFVSNPKAIRVVYLLSFLLHVGGGAVLASIEVRKPPPPPTVVEMRSLPKPPPKPATPPPPEPEAEPAPAPKAAPPPRAAPAPAPAAAPAASASPDFGLSMASGPGGPGGIAVPTGGGGPRPAPVRQAAARNLQATAAPAAGSCEEPVVKAKAISMPHPAYTDEAREAQIEGKVRVELTLDESGKVTKATVVESLGHGLDEAAVAAVREATFSPATQCGKPVASTFTVAVRFAL